MPGSKGKCDKSLRGKPWLSAYQNLLEPRVSILIDTTNPKKKKPVMPPCKNPPLVLFTSNIRRNGGFDDSERAQHTLLDCAGELHRLCKESIPKRMHAI
jgi:hypothetical protein